MSLINCKNCGLPMSSYIKTCPSCGCSEQESNDLPTSAGDFEAAAEIAAADSMPAEQPQNKAAVAVAVQKPAEAEETPEPKQVDLCPVCLEPVYSDDGTEVCPACGVAHHDDCWLQNGGCGMPGCSAHNEAAPKAAPPRSRSIEIDMPGDNDTTDNFEDFIKKRRGGVRKKPLLIALVAAILIVLLALVCSKFL